MALDGSFLAPLSRALASPLSPLPPATHLEVIAFGKGALDDSKQNISGQGALVRLIEHHNGVARQQRIQLSFTQQHAICGKLDLGCTTCLVFKSNGVPHLTMLWSGLVSDTRHQHN